MIAPKPHFGRRIALFLVGATLWTLLSMFPNPAVLYRNMTRYRHLPVDPTIEQTMGWDLPSDPATVEFFVDSLLVSTPDWLIFRVPWYVPTTGEVARMTHGDCEAKTILLASLLAGKSIPYEIRASFNHIWVDYPGRPERPGESRGLAYLEGQPGALCFHAPDQMDLGTFLRVQRNQLWDAMPLARKTIWLLGLVWLLLGGVLAGGPRFSGDLISQWRVSKTAYIGRAAYLSLLFLVLILVIPALRAERTPMDWTFADLYEVFALAVLSSVFVAWLEVLRPHYSVSFSSRMHLIRSSSLGIWRGRRELNADEIGHFELIAPRSGVRAWELRAALRTGELVPLLRHSREPAARAASRSLGSRFSRPICVRSDGCDYWTAPDEIGLTLREKIANRPAQDSTPQPENCYIRASEYDHHWYIGYPETEPKAVRILLAMATAAAGAALFASVLLALLNRSLIVWFLWTIAVLLLGMTVYAAMALREEILAWLAGVHIDVGDGQLTYHRADGKVESVPLHHIEAIELARHGEVPALAIVTPERVIHPRLYCMLKHREWVRQIIEHAVAQSPQI